MNDAAHKVLEVALETAEERINNHQQEVDALEKALDRARATKESDEVTITELKAALAPEAAPPEEQEAEEGTE